MNSRRLTKVTLAVLCALVGMLACSCVSALGADRHDYLFQFDEVPAAGPHGEAVPLPGPIIEPNAMTIDSGEAYIADVVYHEVGRPISRLDRFDATTGAFLGQLSWPAGSASYTAEGIAVGHAGGGSQVYVSAHEDRAGEDSGIVGVFSPTGTLEKIWRGTEAASKGFGCCGSAVAVDDSSGLLGDWAAGDVYVADSLNDVIDVYEPEGGAGEKKPVAEIKEISPGEPLGQPDQVAVSAVNGDVTVVDEHGVQVLRPAAIRGQYELVTKLTAPAGNPFSSQSKISAEDGEGDIYVFDPTMQNQIFEFDASGEYQGQLTPETAPAGWWGGEAASPAAIATDPETHDVYVGTYDSNLSAPVFVFGPNIVFPDVTTDAASISRPTSATLNGTVQLDKGGAATCQFEWGTSSALGELAPCSAKVESEGKVPVSAALSGLEPGTTYYYRLQATNANGTNDESQTRQLTTLGPRLAEASASEVASTSATLNATIDPDGSATSYYFQYGRSVDYEAQVPLAPGAPLGAGTNEVAIGQHIQGLAPDAVYHYRVMTVSEVEVEPNVVERFELPGRDQTFTTQLAGTGLTLPDGRQWELVSPVDKHGATIEPISTGIAQASTSGEMMTYIGTLPTEGEVAGDSSAVQIQVLSTRGATGWSSHDIMLPHAGPTGPSVGQGSEYRMFSEDLALGVAEPFGGYTSLGDESTPPDTELTPYLRHDLTCATTPASCYEPLVTGAPGYADVPPGTAFGGQREVGAAVSFIAATPSMAHIVLSSSVSLTSAGGGLYEWSSQEPSTEALQSVSILPQSEGGGAVGGQLGAPYREGRAISDDGSRVVWSAYGLYLRDTVKQETVRLDAVQGGSGQGLPEPQFQLANSTASRVFFTDTQRLTEGSTATTYAPDLYECEIIERPSGLECKLSDLTPGSGGRAAGVKGGLLGASEDGSTLYFVASGVLTGATNARGEKAVAGADNLYVLRYDDSTGKWEAPSLIGILSGQDEPDWQIELSGKPARVSSNGRYLAFMSQRPLTGYNNHDAISGELDEEVFLFDDERGSLACVSCDPTGALPHGVQDSATGLSRLVDGSRVWQGNIWLAANIPGWTPYATDQAVYQSRYLSDEGRLFFNSSDALVPQDINGTEDVYEYEPAAVGDCTASSATFSEHSGGCVALISSGTSAAESAFLDASENGDDVFFLTAEKLVPQDVDSADDVYDAHVCNGQAPCSSAPVAAPPCTTADACRAAPAPQPATFGPPASATFSGAGNVTPVTSTSTIRAKTLTRAQRLAGALATCRKRDRSHRGKRATCERQAKKRYGDAKPDKANAKKKRGDK
jgi:hypothetical protein